MKMHFDPTKDFYHYENNEKFQHAIEHIILSIDPLYSFEWISEFEQQKTGIDLILRYGPISQNIDIKAVTYADNHHYLEDISIELVAKYFKFIDSKGQKGKSWLFKDESKTDKLLYFWLDQFENVRSTIIIIPFSSLKQWASSFFNIFELVPFLNQNRIKKIIRDQISYTRKIGQFKDFNLYSHNNKNSYFTISTPVKLTYLNGVFEKFNLELIYQISEKKETKNQPQKLKDFF